MEIAQVQTRVEFNTRQTLNMTEESPAQGRLHFQIGANSNQSLFHDFSNISNAMQDAVDVVSILAGALGMVIDDGIFERLDGHQRISAPPRPVGDFPGREWGTEWTDIMRFLPTVDRDQIATMAQQAAVRANNYSDMRESLSTAAQEVLSFLNTQDIRRDPNGDINVDPVALPDFNALFDDAVNEAVAALNNLDLPDAVAPNIRATHVQTLITAIGDDIGDDIEQYLQDMIEALTNISEIDDPATMTAEMATEVAAFQTARDGLMTVRDNIADALRAIGLGDGSPEDNEVIASLTHALGTIDNKFSLFDSTMPLAQSVARWNVGVATTPQPDETLLATARASAAAAARDLGGAAALAEGASAAAAREAREAVAALEATPLNTNPALATIGGTSRHIVAEARVLSAILEPIQDVLDAINIERAQLGALVNRLDYTMRSLDISSENLSDSESRIRNADMAREMMRFTKSQVLQQAGVSMLSHANNMPNNLLQLLN
jgi:flagellin-like hook-associated protein FlgL